MNPLSLSIDGFRSFREPQVFVFPSEPGLYFMRGDNQAEPRLGGNGAGKSTVWEALHWCLQGRTSRGLKGGEVCSWGRGKGTSVAFAFEAPTGEGEVVATRQWGPIRHYAEHAAGGQKTELSKGDDFVLGWLGLADDQFAHCVLMAQGQPMFLDLKPEPRASLFAGVLGLDRWVESSARAGRMASDEDARLRRLERELAAAEARLGALADGVDTRAADRWEAEREERLQKLAREHEQFMEYSTAKEDLTHAEKLAEEARATLRGTLVSDKLKGHLRDAREGAEEVRRRLAAEQRSLDEAERRLGGSEAQEVCPTCGQRIGKAEHLAHVRKARAEVDAADEKVAALYVEVNDAAGWLAEIEKQVAEAQDAEDRARQAVRDAEYALSDARRHKLQEDQMLDRIEYEAERLEKQVNPHLGAAERAREAVEEARSALEEARRAAEASARRHSLLALWVRGFKEVRLQEMAEALTELEIEVNSACAALGLVDWEIGFAVDRESKSGSLQRGFAATVSSPAGGERVPWEAWSGGESQRLRLAAQMGLADMIRSRTRCPLPLEVWDEPTQGLSPEGAQDLFEALASRAAAEGRQVWIVDHRNHAFGGFAGGADVVKTAAGSRVERW